MAGVVTERDRRLMHALARDLRGSETDDRGDAEWRAAALEVINADRAKVGAPPLQDRAPEEGFYERARSLGMDRIDR